MIHSNWVKCMGKEITQVFWRTAKGFKKDNCVLRSASLTLYTLFSIVPVMAMAFGIAKGFGFQAFLESKVLDLFVGQEEVANKILVFSTNLLEKTKGGLMAILGVILLVYALVKLMGHIEDAFNKIWQVKSSRSALRKITDYLSISLAAGLMVLFSGSANIFITTRFEQFFSYLELSPNVEGLISLGLNFLPYVSTWILFIFFYVIIPNKKNDIKAAVVGGVVAGTLFQILQLIYFKFQVGVSSYNAIYGSFAALPLFLIWVQYSWMILLVGAEIAFAWENSEALDTKETPYGAMGIRFRKRILLKIVHICVKRFANQMPPVRDSEISKELKLPLPIVHQFLGQLVSCRLLFEVVLPNSGTGYSPGMDIESLSIMDVLSAVEKLDDQHCFDEPVPEYGRLEESFEKFERAARESDGEQKLRDI